MFTDLEEGVAALFDEAATVGKQYSTNFTHEVEVDNRLARRLRSKAKNPFAKSDYERRLSAEMRSKRIGRIVPPDVIERRPCPHCGALRTHVLTGKKAGHIYHTGKWEELEAPCRPIEVAA